MLSCEGCAWKKKTLTKKIGGTPCHDCVRSPKGISSSSYETKIGNKIFKTPLDLYISEDMLELILASIMKNYGDYDNNGFWTKGKGVV